MPAAWLQGKRLRYWQTARWPFLAFRSKPALTCGNAPKYCDKRAAQ